MSDRATQFHRLYQQLRITDQKDFYAARRDEYQAAHSQAVLARNLLLGAAALAGIAGQFTGDEARALISIGAAVLAALAGLVTAFEALIGFPRLAKLYDDAWINLSMAEIEWDGLDPAGDLTGEMHRVEQVFRKENGQWGQLALQADSDEPEPKQFP
jgi:conflict system pore-forming effector with SLATT domain